MSIINGVMNEQQADFGHSPETDIHLIISLSKEKQISVFTSILNDSFECISLKEQES